MVGTERGRASSDTWFTAETQRLDQIPSARSRSTHNIIKFHARSGQTQRPCENTGETPSGFGAALVSDHSHTAAPDAGQRRPEEDDPKWRRSCAGRDLHGTLG